MLKKLKDFKKKVKPENQNVVEYTADEGQIPETLDPQNVPNPYKESFDLISSNPECLEKSSHYLMHLKVTHSVESNDKMPKPGILYIMKRVIIFHQLKGLFLKNQTLQAIKNKLNTTQDRL